MTAARVIVTAETPRLGRDRRADDDRLRHERDRLRRRGRHRARTAPDETPDGRPGVSVLVFAFSRDALEKALANRVGQCVMTCPTTACYNGLPVGEKTISVGGRLRYFGDGWQISKRIGGRRYWRIPVMDGEFLCEETFGTVKGVAGGNIILMGAEPAATLAATEAAVAAMRRCRDVILPFPGGIARSGSKVGSKYKAPAGQHQHGLRPDAPRRGPDRDAAGRPLCLRDRDRRPDPRGRRACHGRRPARPRAAPRRRRGHRGQLRRQARPVPHPPARRPGSIPGRST